MKTTALLSAIMIICLLGCKKNADLPSLAERYPNTYTGVNTNKVKAIFMHMTNSSGEAYDTVIYHYDVSGRVIYKSGGGSWPCAWDYSGSQFRIVDDHPDTFSGTLYNRYISDLVLNHGDRFTCIFNFDSAHHITTIPNVYNGAAIEPDTIYLTWGNDNLIKVEDAQNQDFYRSYTYTALSDHKDFLVDNLYLSGMPFYYAVGSVGGANSANLIDQEQDRYGNVVCIHSYVMDGLGRVATQILHYQVGEVDTMTYTYY